MARTRAQEKAAATTTTTTTTTNSKSSKRGPETAPTKSTSTASPKKAKHASQSSSKTKSALSQAKAKATSSPSPSPSPPTTTTTTTTLLNRLLTTHSTHPVLSHPSLSPNPSASPSTLLALLLHALLSSARISHTLAARATTTLLDANYHDLATLEASSLDERCKVLTQGGYARYREKTAGELGELGRWLRGEYGGDLNSLITKANGKPGKVRELLKKVKGIGDVGVDIFMDTAQGVVLSLAPFLDPRSRKTAERIGLGGDVQGLFELVGRDPVEMCKLASALTSVRLEKVEGEFVK